ncbi:MULTISPECIES: mechanosensitive ion channel family protein [unclassified Halanaerobium]|uniref:mechanosensitive ion channel family protein n=1 Tax=unclassified Halanaerobium TaxID=2641197 RepID=UPI000DF41DD5|nr:MULTISPECIES: mechanosensitive ion channel domain-containing protein [unclassified Halanaerobium]RCW49848.1 mechanosensitive ion channel-like protein [Halanaerobium sp. MA284_MarDTE_T2]RCW88492.1 mechanosensitive ion channel-like protein [Halanaerobium sp. DL-01]
MLNTQQISKYYNLIIDWIYNNLFVFSNLIELAVLLLLSSAAYFLSKILRRYLESLVNKIKPLSSVKTEWIFNKLSYPFTLMFLIGFYYIITLVFSLPNLFISIAGNLITAWVIIKFISIFLPRKHEYKILSVLIWAVAALKILNIYDETISFLDSLSFSSGNLRISLLLILKGIIIFTILFWAAGKISTLVTMRVDKTDGLTPSVKVLLNKIAKFLIFTAAVLFTLSSIGIDLSAFAFLGGAIGVGIGFGLQKIVSNFISGIIILLDKSIKPGDVVEISDVYGWVKKLDTRFVSIVTRAGKEYLIPNEDFITKEVINWSYSDELVRVDAPVGVSYDSDLRLVEKLILEATQDKDRILNNPEPVCLLKDFGDSSVNFEIRFWINDPRNGIQNIRSKILFSIWDKFKENNIEIPFPQRDYHLKSLPEDFLDKFSTNQLDKSTAGIDSLNEGEEK